MRSLQNAAFARGEMFELKRALGALRTQKKRLKKRLKARRKSFEFWQERAIRDEQDQA